jgi:hypothetical protein
MKNIICDKCDFEWTEKQCLKPATCCRYHFGQFGDKVIFLFCDECWSKPDPISSLRNLDWFVKSQEDPNLPAPSRESQLKDYEHFEKLTPKQSEKWTKEWEGYFSAA